MPRPLSDTVTELSGWMTTSAESQWPAIASSTELSTTSYTRWWRPRGPVEPMYMPGRLRTASSPSSTWMSLASYEWSVLSGEFGDISYGAPAVFSRRRAAAHHPGWKPRGASFGRWHDGPGR